MPHWPGGWVGRSAVSTAGTQCGGYPPRRESGRVITEGRAPGAALGAERFREAGRYGKAVK